jgi:hypothetical protein
MKKMKKRHGPCLFLSIWGKSLASIALTYMVASPTLKAQDQSQQPAVGGSSPTPTDTTNLPQPTASADQIQPALTLPALQTINPKKNEVSVSGDFMLGQGKLTLPVGYSLVKALNQNPEPTPSVAKPPRSSDYFGGTVSYSYGQAWYFDFSYSEGNSTGHFNFPLGSLGESANDFTLKDDWYQGYIRYAFPQLRGKRLSAYLRAGVTYIDATLTDSSTTPEGLYSQTDDSTEIRGNLGAGAIYSLYSTRKFRLGLELEGEGYYGDRSQNSQEKLNEDFGLAPASVTINNTLYGGLGRAEIHMEYRFGRSGLFRAFLDGGAELDYTEIHYPSAGTDNELLWGPYVKLGFRYSF